MRPVQPGDIAIIIASKAPSHIGREVLCGGYLHSSARWFGAGPLAPTEPEARVIEIDADWLGVPPCPHAGWGKYVHELMRIGPDDEELEDREKSVKKPIALPEI